MNPTPRSIRLLIAAGCVFAVLLGAFALAVPLLPAEGADIPPGVEVWSPDIYPAGLAFEVRASAYGCTPAKWAWTLPAGCSAVKATTADHVQVRCSVLPTRSATITAKAQGGTCKGVEGFGMTVIADGTPQTITAPSCDGADPQPVRVTLPPAGIYYRPGIQSTGRMNMLTVDGRSVRASVECVEGKP